MKNINADLQRYVDSIPAVADAAALQETLWLNDKTVPCGTIDPPVADAAIADAEKRLRRFAPYLAKAFPETGDGIIESPLRRIDRMKDWLRSDYHTPVEGQLWIKLDSDLPIAGSVKARGGVYEVLKYAETLAVQAGMLRETDDYSILAEPRFREFFSRYKVQVGSTGNLGLSIGIISAKLGFNVIVHMSVEAKQWKKDLLRSKGVTVIEYESDYCEAVARGRENSEKDPMSHFVDDEKSVELFLGYAVAGRRLQAQLEQNGVTVDAEHPLAVYIPCGIGGAPGGVAYGLKRIFGDNVHCFFTEPTQACCMLLGVATGLHDKVCVQDFGISGKTEADGLAVTRPSAFVGPVVEPLLAGVATIRDERLYELMRGLYTSEGLYIEPSSCACFAALLRKDDMKKYWEQKKLAGLAGRITHVVWATGGSLVPEDVRRAYLAR